MTIARLLAAFFVLLLRLRRRVARADALDDTLALFLDDKFPQTEKAIGQLAASGAPTARADSRSARRQPAVHRPGSTYDRLQERRRRHLQRQDRRESCRRRRRRAEESARQQRPAQRDRRGARLADARPRPIPPSASPAPTPCSNRMIRRLLPASRRRSPRRTIARAAQALRQARAAILVASADALRGRSARRRSQLLKERGDQDAQGLLDEIAAEGERRPAQGGGARRRSPRSSRDSRSGMSRRTSGTGSPPRRCCCSPRSASPSPSA